MGSNESLHAFSGGSDGAYPIANSDPGRIRKPLRHDEWRRCL